MTAILHSRWEAEFPVSTRWRVNAAIVIFLAVLASALLGIWTRPPGLLATLWPANAVMLGLLVRFPRLATAPGWLGGLAAFVVADVITGGGPLRTLLLSSGNMVGILTGYLLLTRLDSGDLKLLNARALQRITAAVVLGSIASGFVGALANPLLFGASPWEGFLFWFATEAVNYATFLPVLLTFPAFPLRRVRRIIADRRHPSTALGRATLREIVPILALLAGFLFAIMIGGPGALAFILPGLFWCALRYPIPAVAVLALLTTCAVLFEISDSHIQLSGETSTQAALLSIRLGVTLISLIPLYLATLTADRNAALRALEQLASTDPLTGALNRRAFLHRAEALIQATARKGQRVALLMLDIDHFKTVNDRHGHGGGDRILQAFTHAMRTQLRDGALLGRMGGEEFAILLSVDGDDGGIVVAERLRATVAQLRLFDETGAELKATISVGVVEARGDAMKFADLMLLADQRLYTAKQAGRNRVEWGARRVERTGD